MTLLPNNYAAIKLYLVKIKIIPKMCFNSNYSATSGYQTELFSDLMVCVK